MRLLTYAVAAGLGLASLAAPAGLAPALAADITGAGATFPLPVYAKWAEAYRRETGNSVNYQSIGSGGGVRQIRARTVDFGATDAPLGAEALAKDGLVQFPAVMGGVVPIINVAGIASGQLKLTGPVLADIFQGRITRWNDPRIAELNAGVTLPAATITPVYRSDQSGTTNVFTGYLATVSEPWKAALGSGQSVNWPVGQGGKGNEGVAALVRQVPNAIGYVEYAYAKPTGIPVAQLRNRAGKFVAPEARAFQAAAANADWAAAPGYAIALTDQPGDAAWPITTPTFILVPKNPAKPEQAAEVLRFFAWAFERGDTLAAELDYVPLPDNVVGLVRATWKADLGPVAARAGIN